MKNHGSKRRTLFRSIRATIGFCLVVNCADNATAGEIAWHPKPVNDRSGWNQDSAIRWLVTYGSAKEDWINRLIELPDQSIVAAGFIGRDDAAPKPDWEAVALKFSDTGQLLWKRAFGGTAIDAAWAVRESANHHLILGGFSSSQSAGSLDAYFAVLNAGGELETEKRFGGPQDDRATEVLPTRDGHWLLIGETRSSGAGERDVFAVKVNQAGEEIWRKAFGGPEMDRGFAAVETSDGGVVIAGTTGKDEKHAGLVLKIDEDGEQLWRTLIEGDKSVTPHFVSLLPSGKVVVVGYTDSWGATVHDYFAATVSAQGVIEKVQTLGGIDDDRAMTSARAARGGLWIVGYSKSFGLGSWDILLARVRADGAFEPEVIVVGTANADHGAAIVEARNADLLIGGYSQGPGQGAASPDLLVMRLDPKHARKTSKGILIKTVLETVR